MNFVVTEMVIMSVRHELYRRLQVVRINANLALSVILFLMADGRKCAAQRQETMLEAGSTKQECAMREARHEQDVSPVKLMSLRSEGKSDRLSTALKCCLEISSTS